MVEQPTQIDQIAAYEQGSLPAFDSETSEGEQPYQGDGQEHHCHIDGGDACYLQGTDGCRQSKNQQDIEYV